MKFPSVIFSMKKPELKSCITDRAEYGQAGPFTARLKQSSLQNRIDLIRAHRKYRLGLAKRWKKE